MSLYLVGLGIAFISIAAAAIHLQQSMATYVDVVALFVVFGGTLAVAVITFPWSLWSEMRASFRSLFRASKGRTLGQVAQAVLSAVRHRHDPSQARLELNGLAGEILHDGIELIELGMPADKIRDILEERVHQSYERRSRIVHAVRSLSKYPPAFGLTGTVLGLVNLMRSVSAGADARATGTNMAVALVATMYGLLVANLLVNPAGENIQKTAQDDRKEAELSLQGILLLARGATLLEVQEVLNSYLPHGQRLNAIRQHYEDHPGTEDVAA